MRAIYYDTETTGVRPDKDRIIEIAAYDPEGNRQFVELVNPGCLIPLEATAIHNITNEMVKEAATFREVGRRFMEFCGEDAVLIAHNNDAFDLQFLKAEGLRSDIEWPTTWKYLDTLKWSRRYRPDLPRHALQFLREVYGFPPNQAHRALDDVIVLHQVFSCMVDDLRIEDILALLSQKKNLTHMPFGKHQGKPIRELPSSYVSWLASSGALDKPENMELKSVLETVGLLK